MRDSSMKIDAVLMLPIGSAVLECDAELAIKFHGHPLEAVIFDGERITEQRVSSSNDLGCRLLWTTALAYIDSDFGQGIVSGLAGERREAAKAYAAEMRALEPV